MRNLLLAAVFTAVSMCVFAGDGETTGGDGAGLVRAPILNGLYSVEAPGDWEVSISGDDFSAAFSAESDVVGTLIIFAPNPAAGDIGEYTRRPVEALFQASGAGEITREAEGEIDGFPAHTLWFSLETDGGGFLGWARTVDFNGVAVRAVVLAGAEDFDAFMRTAGPIFDSYEMDADMVEANIDLLREIGMKTPKNPAAPEPREPPAE